MSTTTDTLSHLADIVRLASFAVETRRVLGEIETLSRLDKEWGKTAFDEVTASRQWTEMPETTSAVLDRVADQLQGMTEALDRAEASQRKR